MVVLEDIISGFFAVLGSAVFWFIPLSIVTIVGLFFFNYIQKRKKWKWVGNSLVSLFALSFIFLLGFNLLIINSAVQNTDIEQIPIELRENPDYLETPWFVLAGLALVKSILGALFLCVFLFPFAFFGMTTFELLKKKVKGIWPRIILTCFIWAGVGSIILLWFPWVLAGVIYLLFFGL